MYRYLTLQYTNIRVDLKEILEKHFDMGLIGPGYNCLTFTLEFAFNRSKTICNHAILHDAFGRFYNDYKHGPGYFYTSRTKHESIKKLPLIGHLSGLMFCYLENPFGEFL